MQSIASEALRKIHEFLTVDVPQESYAIVWALWRTADPAVIGEALARSLESGVFADALVYGLLLSVSEWQATACEERRLQLALGRGLPPSALRALLLQDDASTIPAPLVFESMYHMYQKLSKCLDYVTAGAEPHEGADGLLYRIESFGQEVGQWLKVAGGDKASITEDALDRRMPGACEVSAEFGAFVGYSGIRFARCILAASAASGSSLRARREGLVGISFEVDPIHASVARHLICLAGLSTSAEVWLGLLQDTIPLLVERVGELSKAFGFMDQRGTTFHEDLHQIEKLRLFPPRAVAIADNVNKPGAPVFLWRMTRSRYFHTVLWSMGEFASDQVEDWQSVSTLFPPSRHDRPSVLPRNC